MPSSEELNAWMKAVAAHGDRAAFRSLFEHFAPRVKAYLMRSGSSDALAEELVQDTMAVVWRKAALFDSERAGVSTWMFTIARNLRVDTYRRQGAVIEDGDGLDEELLLDDSAQPDEQASAAERERGVREALARLPAEQAHVLRLSFFEEHPHARIAQDLQIPLGTVKSRIRLAMHHLRRLLDDLEP